MNDLVPAASIVEPEQFAEHLTALLGKGYEVSFPSNFAHGRRESFFTVACSTRALSQNLLALLVELGATAGPNYLMQGTTDCVFHIPTINSARALLQLFIARIPNEKEKWQRQQEEENTARTAEAARAAEALAQRRADGAARALIENSPEAKALAAIQQLHEHLFGTIVQETQFAAPIYAGQYGLGLNRVNITANADQDTIFDSTTKTSIAFPRGSFYQQIIQGKVEEGRNCAVYYNPQTGKFHVYASWCFVAGKEIGPENLVHISNSFVQCLHAVEALKARQAPNREEIENRGPQPSGSHYKS